MGLTKDQSIQLYGTETYTGWGETEAKYDAQSKGLSGGNSNPFTNTYNNIMPEINKYVDELIAFAKDDYDFAAKWIEDQFTNAMGTDDVARKEFLKSVSNELEKKVGTIAFDYETGKYRLNEDTTKALNRLNEDEGVARGELTTKTQLEREQQNSNLNQRGIIQGTRENTTGLATRDIGILEGDIANRFDALDRVFNRSEEDIKLGSARGLEDLTTSVRRAGEGAVDTHNYSLEQAERERKSRELAAQQAGKTSDWQVKSWINNYAKYLS